MNALAQLDVDREGYQFSSMTGLRRCPHGLMIPDPVPLDWNWCSVCNSAFEGPDTPHWDVAYIHKERKPGIKYLTMDDCREIIENAHVLGLFEVFELGAPIPQKLFRMERQQRDRLSFGLFVSRGTTLAKLLEAGFTVVEIKSTAINQERIWRFYNTAFPGSTDADGVNLVALKWARNQFYDADSPKTIETHEAIFRVRLARGLQIPDSLFNQVIVGVRRQSRRDMLHQILVQGKKVDDVAPQEECENLKKHAERLRKLAMQINPDPWNDRGNRRAYRDQTWHQFKKIGSGDQERRQFSGETDPDDDSDKESN